jgi:hypothetical protein
MYFPLTGARKNWNFHILKQLGSQLVKSTRRAQLWMEHSVQNEDRWVWPCGSRLGLTDLSWSKPEYQTIKRGSRHRAVGLVLTCLVVYVSSYWKRLRMPHEAGFLFFRCQAPFLARWSVHRPSRWLPVAAQPLVAVGPAQRFLFCLFRIFVFFYYLFSVFCVFKIEYFLNSNLLFKPDCF